MKKAVIIGSSQYREKFEEAKRSLEKQGYTVKIPAFDEHKDFNELMCCQYNRDLIKWADVVFIIWDNRSIGTVFDFAMAFALEKPVRILYIEEKTFAGVMRKYSALFKGDEKK